MYIPLRTYHSFRACLCISYRHSTKGPSAKGKHKV